MTPAAPCVMCGTTRGPMQANTHRAARISLRKWGVDGVACCHCHNTARYRWRHGLDVLTGERPAKRTA